MIQLNIHIEQNLRLFRQTLKRERRTRKTKNQTSFTFRRESNQIYLTPQQDPIIETIISDSASDTLIPTLPGNPSDHGPGLGGLLVVIMIIPPY
ncbi:hypothetical protein Pst134EA_000953 [Puccinia striiformis f. sp. tritici]|uniref:hypothetical protein n=1 Tax=Puccinia striiformis f. sp. tritici TaxID=168172 RepID=UPI0020087A98|nr:hypothetical protein Pst134EA_000953 [Puccinia striiformis f. sp. tritici]KAH9467144.1 hypothetical protein Pst134EB_002169 [Puccinia striiformis f. sp. tritici]KAH9473892.1 hypothetical protein Pst134EA_000953 [Puccinia striiformis f. sp. tritici]